MEQKGLLYIISTVSEPLESLLIHHFLPKSIDTLFARAAGVARSNHDFDDGGQPSLLPDFFYPGFFPMSL
jgi:hypothetical protein